MDDKTLADKVLSYIQSGFTLAVTIDLLSTKYGIAPNRIREAFKNGLTL